MGGPGSGRKSIKGMAINFILEVQVMLNDLLYEHLDSTKSRDELKDIVRETWNKSKVVQEEIERLKQ
jgi:hypothetical protein